VEEQAFLAGNACREFGGSNFNYASSEAERKLLWAARHATYYAACALGKPESRGVITDACVPLSKLAEIMEATARDVEASGVIGPMFGHAGDGSILVVNVNNNNNNSHLFYCFVDYHKLFLNNPFISLTILFIQLSSHLHIFFLLSSSPFLGDSPLLFYLILSYFATIKDADDEEYTKAVKAVNQRLIKATLAVGGTCTGEHGVGSGKKKYLIDQYGENGLNMMRTVKRAFDPLNIFNPGKVFDL
jgi:FAD/FMN-containing dehydrogenase